MVDRCNITGKSKKAFHKRAKHETINMGGNKDALALARRDEEVDEEFSIKPEQVTPALDTSSWPLLLKNYDKRACARSPRPSRAPRRDEQPTNTTSRFFLQCTFAPDTSHPFPMVARLSAGTSSHTSAPV